MVATLLRLSFPVAPHSPNDEPTVDKEWAESHSITRYLLVERKVIVSHTTRYRSSCDSERDDRLLGPTMLNRSAQRIGRILVIGDGEMT